MDYPADQSEEKVFKSGVLKLSRKRMQTIEIGDDIVIEVTEIRRSRVLLSILAPKSVRVLRGELSRLPDTGVGSQSEDKDPAATR